MSVSVALLLDRMRSRLWFIPGLFVIVSALAAFALVPIDAAIDRSVASALSGILFAGGPDSARLVLSTIASAMIAFTGLVFSVTMLVLQLASSQLSPRVTRTFLRDRLNQSVLGLFIATFLYALLVLREVRSPPTAEPFVPAIALTVAYVLLVTCVGAFIVYIHHMTQAMRAATVLRNVADETHEAINRLYPEGIGTEPSRPLPELPKRTPDQLVKLDRAAGVITSIDEGALVRFATERAVSVELLHMVGDFVPSGVSMFRVWQTAGAEKSDDLQLDLLLATIHIGQERTMTQDAAFGFRQIVDIAERALSPGVNDPTTAVQAIDELHDLLRRLVQREIPSSVRLADDETAVLRLPRPDFADYLSLALDEIRHYGAGSIQVARRLRYLLLDLKEVAPAFRQEPIDRQLRLLDAALTLAYELPEDRQAAGQPSASGQGPVDAGED